MKRLSCGGFVCSSPHRRRGRGEYLELGDFRGDVWLLELDRRSNKVAGNSG